MDVIVVIYERRGLRLRGLVRAQPQIGFGQALPHPRHAMMRLLDIVGVDPLDGVVEVVLRLAQEPLGLLCVSHALIIARR